MFWAAALVSMTAPAPVTAPADHWNVDVMFARCRLERSYTQPEPALLWISTKVGSDSYYLEISNNGTAHINARMFLDGDILIDGKAQPKTYIYADHHTPPYLQHIGVTLDSDVIDALAKGSELTIQFALRGNQTVSVPLPDAGKAIAALRRCEAEQLTEWGADPAQFKPGGTRPVVDDRQTFVPAALMRTIRRPKGFPDTMHYLVLSETGVVERCAAAEAIPDSDMEQLVCASLVGKNLGEPARDPAGKPVRGVVSFVPGEVPMTRLSALGRP